MGAVAGHTNMTTTPRLKALTLFILNYTTGAELSKLGFNSQNKATKCWPETKA